MLAGLTLPATPYVRLADQGARDVGAVTVAVRDGGAVSHGVEAGRGAPAEFGVPVLDAGVEAVRRHPAPVPTAVKLP